MAVSYASNVFTVALNAQQTGTGTLVAAPTTITVNGNTVGACSVSGTGTTFTTQLRVGSSISVSGFTNMIVHSIQSNTSLIAFTQNTAGTQTISAPAKTFTYYAPTLWSDLVTAVNAQAATIASTDSSLDIQFKTASLTIAQYAVLVMDDYCSMSFGASSGYRLNTSSASEVIFRNGGKLTFNGNTSWGWLNGYHNVFDGTLTWVMNSPGGATRQDFGGQSHIMSALTVVVSGGGATAGNWSNYILLDSLAGKIAELKLINAVKTASTGGMNAIYLQFQNGTYKNVTFPSTTSTFGVTQTIFCYLSRSAGNTTTLDTPTFPGSSYAFGANLSQQTTAYLIDEKWPDLASGTVGSLVAASGLGMNGGGNILLRQFRWYPGTYYTEGGWNVYLRDSNATPGVVQLGVVSSNAASLLLWQRVSTNTGQSTVTTNYGPFKLLARKAGYVPRYQTFTPTAPRTEAFVPEVDATWTSDQSALTGIAGNSSTKTITLSSGTFTIDQKYDWFQWWMSQNAQMTAFPDTARIDTVSGANWSLPTGWTETVASGVTVNEGTKLTYYYIPTITNSGSIKCVYGTTAGVSTVLEYQSLTNNGAVCIWDYSTGTTELYQLNTSGSAATYTLYYPPGSAGTQKNVARELYGYQRAGETITLAAGKMWVTYSDVQDVGITQATQATVAAYTTLETSEKVYDYIAYKRLDASYIKLGQIATRSGTAIDFGTYSGVVKSSATSVIDITGSVITIKANGLAGTSKYSKIIATPPATWVANSTEIIDINIEDGNGDSSIIISASSTGTFEIWKITDATPPDQYATGTLVATVGTGKWRFLHSDGYKFVVRDTTTNFRVVVEAEKGDYEAALYFGADVQLAQAPDVTIIKNNLALMQIDVDAIKGTGFDSTDSLHAISDAVDALPASILAATVETGATVAESLRLHNSVLGGKVSGAGTGTETFRDLADTKNRLISSVDANGNRTAEVADLT